MRRMERSLIVGLVISVLQVCPHFAFAASSHGLESSEKGTPILLYHRFGSQASDSMTVTTHLFETQLKYLRDNAYTVIPLKSLVSDYLKEGRRPPQKSLAISVDDGHRSVYTEMFPLLKTYRIPITLFIYPSAISNASYAMTWEELREMKATGLVDFQSHTFWHPNFKEERRRLKTTEYEALAEWQFRKSREKLEKEFHTRVDMLAWPFGLYDDDLIRKAAETGYVAAFTMNPRPCKASDPPMVLPRYLVVNEGNGGVGRQFLSIIKQTD